MAQHEESPYDWPEMDLPGMWSQSDFLGGVDVVRGPDWKPGDPDTPVGYDGFGAPLYAHQVPPEGQE